jgi:hypothetical protein
MSEPKVVRLAAPSRNWVAERNRLNDPVRWELSTAERAVLDAIEVHIGDNAEGWPTQNRLALQTGLCERQVRRVVESLVTRGYLEVRLVASPAELPRGRASRGQRVVYRRGPRLDGRTGVPASEGTGVHAMSGHDVRSGPGVRRSGPISGHDVRPSADMVSDKGSEDLNLINPPNAPAERDRVNAEGATRLLEALGGER